MRTLVQFNIFLADDKNENRIKESGRIQKTERSQYTRMKRYATATINFIATEIYYNDMENKWRNQERCNLLIHVARCRTIAFHILLTLFFSLFALILCLRRCFCLVLSSFLLERATFFCHCTLSYSLQFVSFSLLNSFANTFSFPMRQQRVGRQSERKRESNDRSKVWILFIVNRCVSIKWTILHSKIQGKITFSRQEATFSHILCIDRFAFIGRRQFLRKIYCSTVYHSNLCKRRF